MGYQIFAIGLDIVVLIALIGTAVYAVTLNRSLRRLREDKGQLARLTEDLNGAVMRAESAIQGLRGTAQEVDQQFAGAREGAQQTLDELKLITDTAERMADRIERAATVAGPSRPRQDSANGASGSVNAESAQRMAAAAKPAGERAEPRLSAATVARDGEGGGSMGELLRSAVAAAQRDPSHSGERPDGFSGPVADRTEKAAAPPVQQKTAAAHKSWGFASAATAARPEASARQPSHAANGTVANADRGRPGKSKAEQELLAAMQALSNVSADGA